MSAHVTNAWEVFMLFTIPIGGGIPAGVLLAKSRGVAWPVMMLLYLISDVLLACVLEPIFKVLVILGRRVSSLSRFLEVFKKVVKKSTAHYGSSVGPLALVLIAFGVDPMTGRAAAGAAGHGFFGGWLIAITGDMMYFTVLMVSTLWLSHILGDGTVTMLVILALMILLPMVIRRFREQRLGKED